jgi:hypothetical protein
MRVFPEKRKKNRAVPGIWKWANKETRREVTDREPLAMLSMGSSKGSNYSRS